jgi:ribosomal protein L37E
MSTHDYQELLRQLIAKTGAISDRKQKEWHIPCPECGHESTPKDPHFSFSLAGAYCFVCGYKASLVGLARRLDCHAEAARPRPVRRPEPRKPDALPAWMMNGEQLVRKYEQHPRRVDLWNSYKRLSRETIERMRLGVGVLPASRCKHERLIVPLYSGAMFVGLRGRALDCNCGAKWLAPGGTDVSLYPLYNEQALTPGCVVVVCENPVDALMVTERTPYIGVATYSVSYWQDAWTETLRKARPELVVIAYDNDLPGQGGGIRRAEMVREWLRTHKAVPKPAGPKLANTLIKAGLPAVLYDWPAGTPNKFDIGSLLAAGA